jgi:hypothetical protein
MTESVDTGNEAMARRLEELTAELQDLRSQVATIGTPAGPGITGPNPLNAGDPGTTTTTTTTTTEADATMSRRRALRTAGAVAAGAVAASIATVATAGPAAAAPGSFDGNPAVTATGTGPNSIGVSATGTHYAVEANGTTGQGLSAYGDLGGIYAYSNVNNGITAGGQTAALLLVGYNGPPPTRSSVTFIAGSLTTDTSGNLWYCYSGGTPGLWRQISGSTTAGAFHPLSPGRVYDSRATTPAPGVLTSGSNRTISVADRRNPTTGAVLQADFVPVNATAVFANITITNTAASGYLAVNPGGTITADSSVINWSTDGQTLANGVALMVNGSRQLTAVAGGPGSTDFLVDITGYWL